MDQMTWEGSSLPSCSYINITTGDSPSCLCYSDCQTELSNPFILTLKSINLSIKTPYKWLCYQDTQWIETVRVVIQPHGKNRTPDSNLSQIRETDQILVKTKIFMP